MGSICFCHLDLGAVSLNEPTFLKYVITFSLSNPRTQYDAGQRGTSNLTISLAHTVYISFCFSHYNFYDLKNDCQFYGNILGFAEGRRSDNKWQDYSFNGHQVVCHFVGDDYRCQDYYNPVDGDEVPVPHFGLVLNEEEFHELVEKLKTHDITYIVPPHKRFEGQPGEQWTMFFKDPSNNNLEFKAMTHPDNLFVKYNVVP